MSVTRLRKTKILFGATALTMSLASNAEASVFSWRATGTSWSEPTSWSPFGVPNNGDAVQFPGNVSRIVDQDIAAGVTVASISFGASSAPAYVQLTRNQIALLNGGTISTLGTFPNDACQPIFRAPVKMLGDATFSATSFAGFGQQASAFFGLTGPGNLTITGANTVIASTVLFDPSYTGTTTIRSGMLRMGGVISTATIGESHPSNTANQGSYLVTGTGQLMGIGTIGLASSAAITVANGGRLEQGNGSGLGRGEDGGGTLVINGSVIFGDGGRFAANSLGAFSDVIVNGTLDLRGVSDTFGLDGPVSFTPPGSYVVMEYQNRLGSFDSVLPFPGIGYSVLYTSGENSGPGQVRVVLPEPASMACLVACAALVRRRRVRSQHA